MRKIYLILIVLPSIAFSQKIAYVYQDSILDAIPEYKKNLIKVDSTNKVFLKEIKDAKEQLNIKLDKLLKTYNVNQNEDIESLKSRMTPIDTLNLSILMDEDKLIAKRAQNFDNMINSLYKSDVLPYINKINESIKYYAKKNNLEVVLVIEQIRPSIAYIDERKNITKYIIKNIKP